MCAIKISLPAETGILADKQNPKKEGKQQNSKYIDLYFNINTLYYILKES